jgi:hypothetical protein
VLTSAINHQILVLAQQRFGVLIAGLDDWYAADVLGDTMTRWKEDG